MDIKKLARVLAGGAILAGLTAQADIASAFVRCRALWPATFTQCQSNTPVDEATGSGLNSGVNFRVTANRVSGTSNATAAALNSAGTAVCTATDLLIDSTSVSNTCALAPAPVAVFLQAD